MRIRDQECIPNYRYLFLPLKSWYVHFVDDRDYRKLNFIYETPFCKNII